MYLQVSDWAAPSQRSWGGSSRTVDTAWPGATQTAPPLAKARRMLVDEKRLTGASVRESTQDDTPSLAGVARVRVEDAVTSSRSAALDRGIQEAVPPLVDRVQSSDRVDLSSVQGTETRPSRMAESFEKRLDYLMDSLVMNASTPRPSTGAAGAARCAISCLLCFLHPRLHIVSIACNDWCSAVVPVFVLCRTGVRQSSA